MNQIYPAILLLLLSCQGSETNERDRQDAAVIQEQEDSLARTSQPIDSADLFNQDVEFEIIKLTTTASYPSSEKDTSICSDWTLNRNVVKRVIKKFEPIDGPQWHHLFAHLPCAVEGQLKQGNQDFNYSINAGSWLTLSNMDTTVYYGDTDKEFEELFLFSVWIENEEENK